VSKLVILDVPVVGFSPPGFEDCFWWFSFHQTPDIPEVLTPGKEQEYLSWFYTTFADNLEAITEADIDEYVSHYSAPRGMRTGFEYYRVFPINVEQNKEHANVKLSMPVLALGGEYTSNAALTSMKSLAKNVRGGIIPLSGHWIAEERPDFLIEQLTKFFNE
jgi:pimeloyl-ACP methyl ester carboxylesterase